MEFLRISLENVKWKDHFLILLIDRLKTVGLKFINKGKIAISKTESCSLQSDWTEQCVVRLILKIRSEWTKHSTKKYIYIERESDKLDIFDI